MALNKHIDEQQNFKLKKNRNNQDIRFVKKVLNIPDRFNNKIDKK